MIADNFYTLEECSKRLIWLVRNRKIDKVHGDEVKSLFLSLLRIFPDFNMSKLEEIYKECGLRLSQPLISLVKRWNILADDGQRLDLEVFLAPYKRFLRERLDLMRSAVVETQYLKDIFDEEWFKQVNQLIDAYEGDGAFGTDTHTAFIGFIQETDEGGDLIKRLDEAFEAIFDVIGQQRIRSLRDKLRDVSRSLKDYLGTVYEILILGHFALKGQLVEYEPKVGQHRAEGCIEIESQRILVEATVVTTGRDINFRGMVDLKDGANRIYHEIFDKVNQLKEAKEPILLFISPHTMMLPQETKRGITKAF